MTHIVPPEDRFLNLAVATLKKGGIIIFPTETVYGIGADFRQVKAIERIFSIKRRALSLPLLLHCTNIEQVKMVVREIPQRAELLIKMFLPGSLALILQRSEIVPDIITADTAKVGIRIVAQPFFTRIVRGLGVPLAGTSANLSGQPATNNFQDISRVLISQCDIAIDAKTSGSGRASTIVDLTVDPPCLLRKGEIGKDKIDAVIGTSVTELNTGTQP